VQQNVSKLSMDQLGNVTLVLQDGIELRAGRVLDLSENARAVLSSLLNSETRNQILYVDLRYRDMIVKKRTQGNLI
jgi:cell division septal protein FtsQ